MPQGAHKGRKDAPTEQTDLDPGNLDPGADQSLDLDKAGDPSARAALWQAAVPRIFDGLAVTVPRSGLPQGRLSLATFGPGRAARIEGSAHRVEHRARGPSALSQYFNVLLQLEGTMLATHAGHTAELEPGDFVLIDSSQRFTFEFAGAFSQLLLQLPRDLVLRRHQGLGQLIGRPPDKTSSAQQLVFQTLQMSARTLGALSPMQRAYVFDSCVSLLGAVEAEAAHGRARERLEADRLERARADIEAALADPDLSASAIAARQGVSRRRLDQMFAGLGTTVTAYIWERRLMRLAADLKAPALAHRPIIDLAFSLGFSDAAHVSRAFRRRFGISPRAFRHAALGPA